MVLGPEAANYPIPGAWTLRASLMCPPCRIQIDRQFRPYLDWRVGGTNWSIDYPRSDRRRTRIDAKSVEQRIDLDDDDKCV